MMMIKFLSTLLLAKCAVADVQRNLQVSSYVSGGETCVVDLSNAQSTTTEVRIRTERNTAGTGYFNIRTYKGQYPWTTPTADIVYPGWCLDFQRFISFADYSMDVHALGDDDLPNGIMADGSLNTAYRAVDKMQNRNAVTYVINKKYVGKTFAPTSTCNPTPGTPFIIRWQEVQLAFWKIIDDVDTTTQSYVTGQDCVAKWIADDAILNGKNYVLNCKNPGELVPLAYTFDDFDGAVIKHQVVISEYLVSEIEGMCSCDKTTPAPTTPPTPGPTAQPTLRPTTPPSPGPTVAPTPGATAAPTPGPTETPTKAPVVAPTSPPAPDQPPVGDRNGPPTYVKGDPHFKTFGGELYDFHGECDLVLLHSPDFKDGLGMDIHIRTKIEDFWSSVESAAIRLGDDVLEIKANPESDEWLWLNGQLISSGLETGKWHLSTVGGLMLRYKESSASVREANIYIKGSMELAMVKTFKSFVRVDVDWESNPENYMGSVGLLGSFDQLGKRVARDGVTPINDPNEFGQEWQVVESDPQLFHSYVGAVVDGKCVMPPAYTPENAAKLKRRLRASNMTEEDAEKACDHLHDPEEVKACVYDVIATQDLSMASAW